MFHKLKDLFNTVPVLLHLDPLLQFMVEVDVLDTGVGNITPARSFAIYSLLKATMMWGIRNHLLLYWPLRNGDNG